ncbi:MAG: type II secretion system protein M [Deltaproteobacteria bacterium]|nr:type II secretion system protein M [Deltaproteobacteria bacterium]MBW2307063.1 type II secretion system protein M [Deltaproteobacteria bacterium]
MRGIFTGLQQAKGLLEKFWKQRGVREKCLIGGAIGTAAVLMLNYFIIEPFVKDQQRIQNEIPIQRQVLAKYSRMAAARQHMEGRLEELTRMREALHQRLLEGNTPALAAAGLQDMLQKMANEHKVVVRVMRVVQPRPLEMYMGIPVLIEVQTRIPGLTAFLYSIENNQRLLRVGKLEIRVIDLRKPLDIRATLMVEGFSLAPRNKAAPVAQHRRQRAVFN